MSDSGSKLPSWMYSPSGGGPPSSTHSVGSRRHSNSFSFDPNPSWMDEESESLLPTHNVGITRRNFLGPMGSRKSTDYIFVLLLAGYWIGMLILGIVSFVQDDLSKNVMYITEGMNYKGESCGGNASVYFPDWDNHPNFGICVDECPHAGQKIIVDIPVVSNTTIGQREQLHTVNFTAYETYQKSFICVPTDQIDEPLPQLAQLDDTLGRIVGGLNQVRIM